MYKNSNRKTLQWRDWSKKQKKRIHDENTEQFFSLSLLHIQLEPDTTKRILLPSYSARLTKKIEFCNVWMVKNILVLHDSRKKSVTYEGVKSKI